MPFSIHDIDLVDGSTPTMQDRLIGGLQLAVANLSGAAGAAVTTAVSFPGPLPATYSMFVDCGQAAIVTAVTSKTSTGFKGVKTSLAATTFAASHTAAATKSGRSPVEQNATAQQ